ncbi:MAG TPA: glycosyltransferase [Methylomirabilota bacterium]|nr:glycosyltransferase [Methylomirabilota bacterium]
MRILNVTETYAPFLEFGGPPVKVRALAQGLARRGHAVNVLTADWGLEKRLHHHSEPDLQALGWDRSPFGWRHTEEGVQSIYLPSWFRYRALSWNPAVKRYCRARLQNFDLVHIFGIYDLLGYAVAAAARSRNMPYVVEPIGMFVPIVRNVWLKRMYHYFVGQRLFAGASTVIATSDLEVQELAAAGVAPQKIVLRRNGVESPASWPLRGKFRASLEIPEQAKLILFLGRLSPKKSPELLLQAFGKLPQRIGEHTLMLAFAGPDDSSMQQHLTAAASRLGISSRVKFSGPLYSDDKWAAYRDADVFVLPSQNENFGNTAAEAVAAGTPVVVTQQCGIAPLVKDVAGLMVAHDETSVANALERLLRDPQLHAKFVSGCVELTSRLSWEEPVSQMETLYATLTTLAVSSVVSRSME